MKLNERGRGKFKPAPDYSVDDVKNILFEKIAEETEAINEKLSDKDEEKLDLHYDPKKFNVLSLFSGCGGLDLGFELAGLAAVLGEEKAIKAFHNKEEFNKLRHKSVFHTIYTNDLFKEANETYKLNFPDKVFQHFKDIRKVKTFPKSDLVLGGFPCPGFSEAGPRLIDDERNFLYIHFIRCLLQSRPKFFIAENVKGMMTLGKGEVLKQIIQDFASAGYNVKFKLLNSRDYGVPQLRERVIIVGIRKDVEFEYEYPEATHGEGKRPYITLEEAIGDLREDPGPYFTGSYSTIYLSRNRKKRWDEQSFTIQASGRQAPLHPGGSEMMKVDKDKWILPGGEEQHRRLSVREIARIQTFPDWFEFSDGGNSKISINGRLDKIYKQIGNAVPVMLAKAVAQPIADWVFQQLHMKEENTVTVPNVLNALENIITRKYNTFPEVLDHKNKNRINGEGDLLEYYVKDAFSGKSFDYNQTNEKLQCYQEIFSYLGNSSNPPDFILKQGPAVEVKKIDGVNSNAIALNSSHPKDYLYVTDSKIKKACRTCEDEYGGWTVKDNIYAVGNVQDNVIHSLWFIYGDCFCADKEVYEGMTDVIKTGVTATPGLNFSETKELGRINNVDPLGVTYLRIRGMWGIEHPSAIFNEYIQCDDAKTNVYVLMKKETYENLTNKPDFSQYVQEETLKIKEIRIPDPNNPAKLLDAILFTAIF
ncbi:TPA: DNA (cytosine-5-)-methyltransferase [Bacillus cereus]